MGSDGFAGSCEQQFERRWVGHFGVLVAVVVGAWRRPIDKPADDDSWLEETEPKHSLWALLFSKTHSNECDLAGKCGVREDNFRKWLWLLVEKLSCLETDVVSRRLHHLLLFCSLHFLREMHAEMAGFSISSRITIASD